MSAKRIYLDVCILCRPFDDQNQVRIRLETDALALILAYIREAEIELVVSPVHLTEINSIRDEQERQHLLILLNQLGSQPEVALSSVRNRTDALANLGMGVADAAHVAFAEATNADFVTVDDRLLRQCRHLNVNTWYGTPLAYCDKENLK